MEDFDFREAMEGCLNGKFRDELPPGRISLAWVQDFISRLQWTLFVVDEERSRVALRQLDENVRAKRIGVLALRAHGLVPELPGETVQAREERLRHIVDVVIGAARGELPEVDR